jgi:hypothetical protein
VALVSCVKKKAPGPRAARDLYVSPLFRGMRAYAETHAEQWYILSAEHGLLRPDVIVAPYERTLLHMRAPERREWAGRVIRSLEPLIGANDEVIVLAGARYREHLLPWLEQRHIHFSIPLAGLRLGQQLQWLRRQVDPDEHGHA